jgi:uncharacterized protein
MPNHLGSATSPYLLQHAANPVDWFEWGQEAFDEAEARDVPLLISIGYSACHWCHVMAHESFEDPEIAQVMNRSYVCIKVDREERPDVDAIYMDATLAMSGHGGWPMTVFATPGGRPFHCGTYYPPTPHGGTPSFGQLLFAVADAWRENRDDVTAAADRITTALSSSPGPDGHTPEVPAGDALDDAVSLLVDLFDDQRGGFGGAPKFPPSMTLEHLLRHHARTGSAAALEMVERTCEAMARGGMYDQLAGGFARYSVDKDWVVPHFEKMLYDNALLLRVYSHWWRTTHSDLAARIVSETADFMLRELRTDQGGFASSLDADSDGGEGRFYVWTPQQIRSCVDDEELAEWAIDLFSVTSQGTFEAGASVLQRRIDPAPGDKGRLADVRNALLHERDKRVRPGRDDKIVTAWNGLAIAALAEASALFDRDDWIEAATSAADLMVSVHLGTRAGQNRLARVSRDGVAGPHAGVLEDYADLAEGLLALYSVTSDESWYAIAGLLLDTAVAHFADGAGGFYDAPDDAELLVRRPHDPTDNATPSGASAMAGALLSYAAMSGSVDHFVLADRAIAATSASALRYPRFGGWALAVAEARADGPREIAVVGALDDPRTEDLRRIALNSTAPGAVVAVGLGGIPLLADRLTDEPTAFVCRGFVCDRPTADPAVFARQVSGLLR